MRPLDPRVLPHLQVARKALATVVVGNLVGALLLVAQAVTLAAAVAALVRDPSGGGWHLPAFGFAATMLARAAVAYVVDVAAARAAVQVGIRLRDLVLGVVLRPGPAASAGSLGQSGILATRGVAAVEPYLTRYLPALVLAAAVPVVTVLAIAAYDPASALVVVVTLPLLPIFAILIGMSTPGAGRSAVASLGSARWALRRCGARAAHPAGVPTCASSGAADPGHYRPLPAGQYRCAAARFRLLGGPGADRDDLGGARRRTGGLASGRGWPGVADGPDGAAARAGGVLAAAPRGRRVPRRRRGHGDLRADPCVDRRRRGGVRPGARGGNRPDDSRLGRRGGGELRIENLDVTWPGRGTATLRDVSLSVPARGLTVLTGPSGCGKSTLLAALRGEVAHTGAILVGGTRLEASTQQWWSQQVAVLGQRPWLRDDTIAANLRLGAPEADDAAVRTALAAVRLDAVVDALPEGIDTPLGEDGAGLSAGQRARLALARVVVSDRPYVLLDEPTAHLDAETEAVLVDVITTLARTRCVIAVAHRPALIDAADRVLALTPIDPDPALLEPIISPVMTESSLLGPDISGPKSPDPRLTGEMARDPGVAGYAGAGRWRSRSGLRRRCAGWR